MSLALERVSFTHEGAASPLFSRVSLHCAPGWTGIVGDNGAGKTTLLRLALGELAPDEGFVRRPPRVAHCQQRTDVPPRELGGLLASPDPDACRLRGILGLGEDWAGRWGTLSHGERKRAQVAAALWTRPDALLLDEPTNHVDAGARLQVIAGLRRFRGIGVLVSHDRELLDVLCGQCAFLEPPTLVVRPGNYTAASRVHRDEERAKRRRLDEASTELERLRGEAVRRRRVAAGADGRRSKRSLARGDSDGRERIDRARASAVDGRAGSLLRQMEGRIRQAERRVEEIGVRKRYALDFRLPGTPSPRRRVLALPPGVIRMPGGRRLEHPALAIAPDDRIAVVGPNGSGKSTLVRHLVGRPELEREQVVYLPQEVGLEASAAVLDEFRSLSRAEQGRVLTIVSALGSRPPRLLESRQASPGEIRKLLLAIGAAREPHLIVMDEPTNHLDLPAIECLEDALEGCGAALLLVSHDRRFLERLTSGRWTLSLSELVSRLEIA